MLSELSKYAGTAIARVLTDCEIGSVELCSKIRGDRALTYLEKEKFFPSLEQPSIAAVICPEYMADAVMKKGKSVLISDAPKFAFYSIHNYCANQQRPPMEATVIDESSYISPHAIIAPYRVKIGARVIIEPGAVVRENVVIGDDVHIHSGAVIGAKSFNPARYQDSTVLMEDCGGVQIGDHVDICSQSVIVCGVLQGEITQIDPFAKIDTLVHVAHGVHIGRCSFVASGTVIAGNCDIGANVWIGINSTISNRIHIGDGARVSLGAVVTKDVSAGQTVTGNFAIDHQTFLKNLKASL